MLAHSGPTDVLLICDGRSRTCHSELESLLESARHLSEIWVVYTPTPRLGRKVKFGSDNRETALVSLLVARTLLNPVRFWLFQLRTPTCMHFCAGEEDWCPP